MKNNADIKLVRKARISLFSMFALIGIVSTAWVPRIPEYKRALNLSNGHFSLLLLASTFGAMAGAQVLSFLLNRFSSRQLAFLAILVMPSGLYLIGSSHTVKTLLLGLFILGFGYISLDICANLQAVNLEKKLGRRQLSSFHGTWSVGAFSSALIGGVVAKRFSPLAELHVIAITSVFLFLLAVNGFLKGDLENESSKFQEKSHKIPWVGRSTGKLWGVGMGLLGALVVEGAAGDWGGIMLHENMKVPKGLDASAFASFALAMILGRLRGDWAFNKFGVARTVKMGGMIGGITWFLSICVAVPLSHFNLTASVFIVCIGFAAAGLGVGPMFPAFTLEASALKGIPASVAISRVNLIGLGAFFIGPVITGGLATLTNLPFAMCFPITLLLVSGRQSRIISHQ